MYIFLQQSGEIRKPLILAKYENFSGIFLHFYEEIGCIRAPPELMLWYSCYFDFFKYKWQIGCVDMVVFSSQPTELP
jgi:hypothetical protein